MTIKMNVRNIARFFVPLYHETKAYERIVEMVANVFKYTYLYSGSNKIIFQEEDTFVTVVPLDEKVLYSGVGQVINSSAENDTENISKNQGIADGENTSEKVGEKLPENVTENNSLREMHILNLLKENPSISFIKLSESLSVTRMTIARDIAKLKAKGSIERIGPDKGGYWRIMK